MELQSKNRLRLAIAVVSLLLLLVFGFIGDELHPSEHGGRSQATRSSAWRKTRLQHLEKHPRCEACGFSGDGLQVHHVVPFHLHPELELDPENLITLCGPEGHNCHFVLGHLWNFKKSNPDVRKHAKMLREMATRADEADEGH